MFRNGKSWQVDLVDDIAEVEGHALDEIECFVVALIVNHAVVHDDVDVDNYAVAVFVDVIVDDEDFLFDWDLIFLDILVCLSIL